MRVKTTLLMLVVLAALVWLWQSSKPAVAPPSLAGTPLLAGVSTADVGEIKVLSLNRSLDYLFRRRVDGTWWMVEPVEDLASMGYLNQLVTVFDGSTRKLAFKAAEITEKILKDTGLATPRASAEFRTGETKVRVDIGEEDVSEDAIFVRIDGDIYRSRSALWSATQINVEDAREKTVFRTSPQELQAIEIERRTDRGTETLRLEGRVGRGFEMTKPIKSPVDATLVNQTFSNIIGLRLARFAESEQRDLALLGLDPPALTITVESSHREVVKVGKGLATSAGVFVWIPERKVFGIVEMAELERQLQLPLDDFRARWLVPWPAATSDRIRVHDTREPASRAMILQKRPDGGWDLVQPMAREASPVEVGNLCQAIDQVQVREFLPVGAPPPESGLARPGLVLEMTRTRDGAKESVSVRIGDDRPGGAGGGPAAFAQREGLDWCALVNAAPLPQLRQHWTQVLERRVQKLQATGIVRVDVRRPGSTVTLRRVEGKWRREGATQEDTVFAGLLEDLVDLRATGVVAGRADEMLGNAAADVEILFFGEEQAPRGRLRVWRRSADETWVRAWDEPCLFVLKPHLGKALLDLK